MLYIFRFKTVYSVCVATVCVKKNKRNETLRQEADLIYNTEVNKKFSKYLKVTSLLSDMLYM